MSQISPFILTAGQLFTHFTISTEFQPALTLIFIERLKNNKGSLILRLILIFILDADLNLLILQNYFRTSLIKLVIVANHIQHVMETDPNKDAN